MPETTIPAVVDLQLRGIAERAAGQYPDPLLTAMGWTRTEYVNAIHNQLRNKYRSWHDAGRLEHDRNGQIRLKEAP